MSRTNMAAAMAHHPSGLPTIKCSSCSQEIDIAQMSDHVCSPEPAPSRGPMERFNNAFSSMRSNDRAPFSFRSKPSPAGINTSAANRPFLHPSPPTSNSGHKSPFRMPLRSATSPLFRTRSPSPDLPLAQECAFPTFPTSRSATPTTPGTSSRPRAETQVPLRNTESRNWSRRTTSSNASSRPGSPSATNASNSRPLTHGSESGRKGSFSSIRSRPDMQNDLPAVPPVPALSEQRSHSPAGSIAALRLPFASPQEEHPPREDTPSEASLEHTPEQGSLRRPSTSTAHFRKPSLSAATRPLHEIGSTRSHRSTLSRGGSPNKFDVDPVPLNAKSTGERSDRRLFDAPPVPGMSTAKLEGQDVPLRSQSASGIRPQNSSRSDMPPMPAPTKANDFDVDNNPYHTPTESTSSSDSAPHTSSSRSSPPTSTSSFGPIRKQSDAGEAKLLDHFTVPEVPVPAPLHISVPSPVSSPSSAPPTSNTDELVPQPLSAAPLSAPADARPAQFQQPRRRPAKSFSRPNYAQQPLPSPQPKQPPQPESPLDPALQGGRLPFMSSQDGYGGPGPTIQAPHSAPTYHQTPNVPRIPLPPPPTPQTFGSVAQRAPRGPSPARRATTSNKGNCRGCGEVIKGKSVSSADGRLTGRWHKECFVCKTCSEPFQTMDFYVLGNYPYCARHYHELNRSMCVKCDRGIEGHYVETDRRMKYHPHCFTCQDCHLILRDNYFEEGNGKILCEQHAFRGNHLGPGRRFPEKRSTRLMMMM